MKQIKCSEMGGPATCDYVISGATAKEMVDNGMVHVNEAHPELSAQIQAMTPEESAKWMTEFEEKFAALPEMEAPAEEIAA